MTPALKIFHRGLILVGVPFLLELILILGLAVLLYQSDRDQLRESTYRKIASTNARLIILTVEAPYYLVSSIRFGSEDIYKVYQNKYSQIRKYQKKLIALLNKAPDLSDGALETQESINTVMKVSEDIAAARKGNLPELMAQMGKVISSFDSEKKSVAGHLAEVVRSGEIRTREMEEKQARVRRLQSLILTGGVIANLLGAVFLAMFFAGGISKRLGTIRQNTVSLSNDMPFSAPLKGSDEIARLDQAFHAMNNELKQAAAREKELFDNASDVICVLDYNNRFVKVNLACQRVWGYSATELAEKTLSEIIHPDDANSLLDQIAKGKVTGEPFVFENRMLRSDGTEIETGWSSYWSRMDRQLYCVVHDISERKRTERIKKKFLAMISSDLKRPLSEMSASVSILVGSLAETLSQNAVNKLGVAGKNLQRLLGLVNDLLQVAEMDSSSIDIKKDWCDTEEQLVRSVQEVEALAGKKQIALEVKSCRVQWLVDANRIVQVLVNLLSNAIKFSPEGEVVTLSAEQRGDVIEVKVRDRGRGVPEAHREAIFEKFKQVEAADGKRKSGTGLGLPICKQIVEDHGGSIGVESGEGQGSTFWFIIPRDETAALKIKRQKRNDETRLGSAKESCTGAPAAQSAPPEADNPAGANKPDKKGLTGSLKLKYKGAILIGVPLLFELLLVGAMSTVLIQADRERKEELHYRNIAFQTTRLTNMYFMMAFGAISESMEKDWLIFKESAEAAQRTQNDLEQLLKNDRIINASHLAAVISNGKKLSEWVQKGEEHLRRTARTRENFRDAMSGKERIVPNIMKISRALEKICEESERKEFVSPEKQDALRLGQAEILLAGLLINIAGSLALAKFFATDITSRLQILADNAMRLAKEKQLNEPVAGKDEIADLDRTFHDTARALDESRKKERAVFDNSQDVICALSEQGKFLSVNPAAESMWGYKREQLAGKDLGEILAREDLELISRILSVETGRHEEIELKIKKRDEATADILWSFSRAAEHGNILCVAHDITAIKELENIKQEFLSMVSHDLRTPLTSVLGITKLILAGAFGKVDERPESVLKRITKSGDQLLELINDLLDIDKLEAGKMQLVLEDLHLPELIKRASAASHDESRITLDLSRLQAGFVFQADKDRLAQALTSILNHLLDRSLPESTVTLSVASRDSMVDLKVKGSTGALSERSLSALFDRFQSESDREEDSGTGLALPLAKQIIENHSGKISAQSNPDGLLFTVEIPVEQPAK